MYVGRNPLKVDADLLELRADDDSTPICTPCHDRTGQGKGIVGQRATLDPDESAGGSGRSR